jgi:hypothetical protein
MSLINGKDAMSAQQKVGYAEPQTELRQKWRAALRIPVNLATSSDSK